MCGKKKYIYVYIYITFTFEITLSYSEYSVSDVLLYKYQQHVFIADAPRVETFPLLY